MQDLKLKSLGQFIGTENYHKIWNVNVTDGIKYVMDNGYSWFITDFIAVFLNKPLLRNEGFLSIKLKIEDNKAKMIVTDGNAKTLYTQEYEWTDAKIPLNLYCCDGVLMLSGEY